VRPCSIDRTMTALWHHQAADSFFTAAALSMRQIKRRSYVRYLTNRMLQIAF
jgi:hypothetical protein